MLPPSVQECLPDQHLARFLVEVAVVTDASTAPQHITGSCHSSMVCLLSGAFIPPMLIHFHNPPLPEGDAPLGESVHFTIHKTPKAGKTQLEISEDVFADRRS